MTLRAVSAASGSQSDICTAVFIVASFPKAKPWKQSKCSFIREWIKKICYIHMMEYYSTLKRNPTVSDNMGECEDAVLD